MWIMNRLLISPPLSYSINREQMDHEVHSVGYGLEYTERPVRRHGVIDAYQLLNCTN